jgi:transposase
MPAKYVRPYSKGQNNDFRDAEAIAEAVQRPTMKFVATKTADRELSRAQDHMFCSGGARPKKKFRPS